MDRIDLQVGGNRLKPEEITQQPTGERLRIGRSRVEAARSQAQQRFQGTSLRCNAEMQAQNLREW